ncbi:unnamed protein product [Lactuca virosa]|uniref:Uncharacterized protein n=1 Tax=Lactuca virosa TaxID=75947 RepID=A0AAU9NMW7_9ASTR|nr:unnamed protein product [Lactuca virosa]
MSIPQSVKDAIPSEGILGSKPVVSDPKAIPTLSSVKLANSSAAIESPVKSASPYNSSYVHEKVESAPVIINDDVMKDSLNGDSNLDGESGSELKMEQGANFLNLKWDKEPMNVDNFSKPTMSPAAKLVSDFNKKSYARMVESTSSVVDLNIKVIPKVDGKPNGKVELPYAD